MPRISDGNGTDPVFVGPAAGKKRGAVRWYIWGVFCLGGFIV